MNDLAGQLGQFCRSAGQGNKVVAIHLFGIKHASILDGADLHALAERAGIGRSFGTELRKGVRLAEYVQIIRTP